MVRVESGGRLCAEPLIFLRQRHDGRNGGVLVLVLGLASRGQVSFQRVHVRRKARNLAENVDEIQIQDDGCKM